MAIFAPTKRHRLTEWIQKQGPYICCLQETHFRHKDTYRPKVRGWKNMFYANEKQKKAGVATLISDKIDVKEDYKTYGRTLHNDQGINPRVRHKNCKYLCTQHRSTLIYETNCNRHRKINWQYNSNSRRLQTPHSHQRTDHQNRKLIRKHKS